jgi:hypothetical protein
MQRRMIELQTLPRYPFPHKLGETCFSFLAYFPYFKQIKQAYEITLLSVRVSVYPPIVARERLGSVKIPLTLLGNGSVEQLSR